MSKHWRPDETAIALRPAKARRDWSRLHSYWLEEVRGRPLPHGSRTALALMALACVAAGIGLYALIGPKDVFERDLSGDWTAVEGAAAEPKLD